MNAKHTPCSAVRLTAHALTVRPGAPWLLDLFSGAGGAAVGYWRAGFNVVGVDIAYQPRYPFFFIQGDALDFARQYGALFDVIHASPPCQMYSHTRSWAKDKPMLISDVRELLVSLGKPYVIENVAGAARHMKSSLMLCGLSFGLKVFRHRYFESSVMLLGPSHPSHAGHRIGENGMCSVVGNGDANWSKGHHVNAEHRTAVAFNSAMGINWMTKAEIVESIPPAYTEYIGAQLRRALANRAQDGLAARERADAAAAR